MAAIVPKKKPEKTCIPQKGQVSKPPQKTWKGKEKLDEETQRELRRISFSIVVRSRGNSIIDAWEKVKSIILR
jgi:hypothetical protein